MSRILIDSDVLIHFLRGNSSIVLTLQNLALKHEPLCSVITIGEVLAGMRKNEQTATYKLLHSLDVIPLDFDIAELAGQWKGRIKSHHLELDDCFIAASSVLKADYLLTLNKKHYPMPEIQFYESLLI